MHFVDNEHNEVEYQYDANGNMIGDDNSNKLAIEYNSLNLPSGINISEPFRGIGMMPPKMNYIYNLYSAAGTKFRTTYESLERSYLSLQPGNLFKIDHKVDYCENYIYENDTLSCILTPEGYVAREGNKWIHYFYHKDHLGNIRVVVNGSDYSVKQVNHYYPFGSLFGESTKGELQKYKYNGKELVRMYGLDWYDYGARWMDPVLGRFISIDPMCEKYYSISPYAYCNNNPMKYVDPNGMFYDDYLLDKKGNINLISTTDDIIDKLYAEKENGIIDKSNYIEFLKDKNGNSLLSALNQVQTNYDGNYVITKNQKDAGDLFSFVAKNSDLEWGFSCFKDGDNVISTSHQNERVSSATNLQGYSEINLLFKVHSHPGIDAPEGASLNSVGQGDMVNIINMANRFNELGIYNRNFPKHFVYHQRTNTLYQYTPYIQSLKLGVISKQNTIIDYINKSYNSLYHK